MRPIESFWSSVPPSLTVPAGASCDGRPLQLRVSNSRAFVSVTSASPCSFPSKSAGPLLLSRHLCPDGFKSLLCGFVALLMLRAWHASASAQLLQVIPAPTRVHRSSETLLHPGCHFGTAPQATISRRLI